MDKSQRSQPIYKGLIAMACVVIVVAGLKAATSIVVPFLLSVFITVILFPLMQWMVNKKVPAIAAVLVLVVLVLGVFSLIGTVVGNSVGEFSRSLPHYQNRLAAMSDSVSDWVEGYGISVPREVIREHMDLGATMRLVANMLAELGGVLTNAFFILFAVIFMLLEASGFPNKVRAALDSSTVVLDGLGNFSSSLKSYVIIKTVISVFTGVTAGVLLAVLGVDFAGLFGLVAFLLNYIPTIGSIIAAVPAVLLAAVQLGAPTALIVTIGFVVINVFYGNVIEPRFMGRGLGLSTFVVFISLVFWGWVFGLVGSLLSVPLTMTLKIALGSSEETKWIAVLLGPEDTRPEKRK